MSWVRVGDAALWKHRRSRQVEVEGEKVAVFRDGERFIAVGDTCPHMGASLADGKLENGVIQCSWHEWRYDASTGQCPIREWAKVRVYEVERRGDGVWVRAGSEASAPPR
jgi:nitrite reductase (NADH) small subunit/3-phenylpropionate/trans-cinnamate dioxygenase ferredoxin subunit